MTSAAQPTNSKGQPITTLTGRPLKYEHDTLSNVMLADGGGFASGVGANHLPHGYTDDSIVQIPIKFSDLEEATDDHLKVADEKKKGLLHRLSDVVRDMQPHEEAFKMVKMSRGDYLKYWAKGEDGNFLPSVVEPPEGRKTWIEKQLELPINDKKAEGSSGSRDRRSWGDNVARGLTVSLGS